MAGLQLNMLIKLAQLYDIPFSSNMVKTLTGVLIGAFPVSLGVQLGSLAKIIPGIGQALGVAGATASVGASTYAVGRVFNRHFSKGGTFLSFNPEEARAFYKEIVHGGAKNGG